MLSKYKSRIIGGIVASTVIICLVPASAGPLIGTGLPVSVPSVPPQVPNLLPSVPSTPSVLPSVPSVPVSTATPSLPLPSVPAGTPSVPLPTDPMASVSLPTSTPSVPLPSVPAAIQPVVTDATQTVSGVGQTVSGAGQTVSGNGQTVGGVVGQTTGSVGQAVDSTGQTVGGAVRGTTGSILPGGSSTGASLPGIDPAGRPSELRLLALDQRGQRVVRGEVLAIGPTQSDLDIARKLRFSLLRDDALSALGVDAVSLGAPPGTDSVTALAELRIADPTGNFDLNHVYNPSGIASNASATPVDATLPVNAHVAAIGMIDAGVDTHHPALADNEIVANNVTGTAASPATAHGTAVASILVGSDRNFHGELPGAKLYAADVFGGDPTGGSALDIARALNWLAENRVAVVNASLAGPSNALLAAAVHAFLAKGHVLVAAAGNQGPAAPPAYPAAYDGVIGVTSVDMHGRLQIDANRGDVSFASLGVGVTAATLSGYGSYTGTSFAAPIVAARFAILIPEPDRNAARAARDHLAKAARRLGDRAAYGFGYVAPLSQSAAR